MSTVAADKLLPVFAELLAELRARGFALGVEHYLRVQLLLERAGGERSPDEWASLLAPVLARNQVEQEQFYEIFPNYLADSPASEQAGDKPNAASAPLSSPLSGLWKQALVIFAAMALLIVLIFLLGPKTGNNANNGNTFDPPDTASATNPFPLDDFAPQSTPNTVKRAHRGFYLAALLLPFGLFLLYEWFRRRRRRLNLAAHRLRQPPFAWPLHAAPRPLEFYEAAPLYAAARSLRRRQAGEVARLDIHASVSATIAAAGFPTLRRQITSKIPEYLLLIDCATPDDHQARLFSALARSLEHEGVFLNYYFFNGDPRVCRNAHDDASFYLTDLQNRHDGHRLLIFGDGDQLLDSITGQAAEWTHIFDYWPQRVLLTPESPARWGRREAAVGEFFTVLPATLTGLASVPEFLESAVAPDSRLLFAEELTDKPFVFNGSPQAVVNGLRRSLAPPIFRWLCACAVHPTLNWELTLQLTALAGTPEELLTEANLLALARLPWFRQGIIPNDVRWELLLQLDPDNEKDIRRFVIALLENNPPPAGTFAESRQALQLAVQHWRLEGSRQRLRELLDLLQKLPRSYAASDATIARWLAPQPWRLADTRARWREITRRVPRPISAPVNDKLSRFNFWRAIKLPPFSLETGAVALLALALGLVSLLAARGFAPRNVEEIATLAPTPTPLPTPTPDIYLPPDAFPVAPPPPDIGQSPYTPPSLPLPTPFVGNPPIVPLPGLAPRPGKTGTPPPLGDPLPLGSPSASPTANASPTPAPTPATQPVLTITASNTGVCLTGPTTIMLGANAAGFVAAPSISFSVNGGKLAAKTVGANQSISQSWDLAQAQPGIYTATAEAVEGKTKKTTSFTAKVYACECVPAVRILCPIGPVTKTPLTVAAETPTVDPNWQARPTYNWSVSGGKITGGQGTSLLTVDLSGAIGQTLQLNTEANGFPPLCKAEQPAADTCQIVIAPALAVLLDEFALGNADEEKARLDALAARLQETKGELQLEIFGAVDANGKPIDTTPITQRLTEYLVKAQRLDAKRIKLSPQPPAPDGKLKVRIYALPAKPPQP